MVSHHEAKFSSLRYCDNGDIKVLVRHLISSDHVIKGPCVGRSPSR